MGSLYFGGKSHVSNGQNVSFKEPVEVPDIQQAQDQRQVLLGRSLLEVLVHGVPRGEGLAEEGGRGGLTQNTLKTKRTETGVRVCLETTNSQHECCFLCLL